jgi:eukaryotic-like serine/threonine-protein kinase
MNGHPPPISRLGRYDIVRVLGQGAMGVVYEARDPNLGRRVAIKTVRVAGMPAEEALDYEKRFDTEARSAGRLQHPNIVSVYDSANHEDAYGKTAYIVMEFVEGEDVKHILDKGLRFSLQQIVGIMDDLLTALDVAHRNKIIHRDIKPANMILTREGRIKLTDFGVARIQDTGEATKTQGSTVGTLKYMSPEQVAGRGVDASSDLFSAGIVLYQLLTGLRPFDGDGYLDIVSKIVKQNPMPPSHLVGALPPGLDAVVAKALAKSKLERFTDAASFAQALKAAVSQADMSVTPSLHTSLAQTVSSSGPGMSSAGSTVTQELELVYWKDIKESQNPDILEGFLWRFPAGIYADLAKHKLKVLIDAQKAAGEASRYEATQRHLSFNQGASQPLAKPDAKLNADATATLPLLPTDPTTPLPQRTNAPASNIVYADVMDSWPAELSPHSSSQAAASSQTSKAAAKAKKRRPKTSQIWLLGSITALALALLYALFLRPSPWPESATAAASADPSVTLNLTPTVALIPAAATPSAPTVSDSPPANLPTQQSSSSATPAQASSAPAPVASVAQAPSASRKKRQAQTSLPPAEPSKDTSEISPSSASKAPANPRAACANRVLLGYLNCIAEQCAKPLYRNHRVCVERREIAERQKRYENTR